MRPKEREKETINHLLRCYPLQRGGEGIVCSEELGEQGLGICVFPHRTFHPPVYPCW